MFYAAPIAVFFLLPALLATGVAAPKVSLSQPTIWATQPDVAAFEKIENDRLAAAKVSITTLLAAKGRRTIENTLVPF
jgi:hypothetical protein